jgi:hypothetical protein
MVNTKLVAVSYCSIFLFILFCAIGYIVLPTYMNKAFDKNIDLPKTAVMNNATSAISAIPTSNLFWLSAVIVILLIVFFLFGTFSMFGAY